LKSVIIPDSVINICTNAFAFNSQLESVTISRGFENNIKNIFGRTNFKNLVFI
jgi:hypothetical protein